MVDVFISYARENQAAAKRLAEAVKREGYSVFWDDDLPPHLSYGEVITEQIGAAKAAIVIWSREAAASEWVRAEADLARSQRKLIQTSIDDRQPPMPFNQIQFASIGDWNGEPDHPGWRKVRASLAALSGRQDAAAGVAPLQASPRPLTPAPPVAEASARRPGTPWVAVASGALILLAAMIGLLLWIAGRDADGDPDRVAGSAAPPPPAEAPRPATALFTRAATIDGPAGFANVHSGPAATFPVVARMNRGEVFTTYPQTRDWWQVRTADSRVGYMQGSRIRMVEPGASAAARPAAPEPAAPAPARAPGAQAPATKGSTAVAGGKPTLDRMRRYCMGAGRATTECRRWRRQMAPQQR